MKEMTNTKNNNEIKIYVPKNIVIKNEGITCVNTAYLEQDKYLLRMFNENYKIKVKNLSEEYQCRF